MSFGSIHNLFYSNIFLGPKLSINFMLKTWTTEPGHNYHAHNITYFPAILRKRLSLKLNGAVANSDWLISKKHRKIIL